MGSFNAMCSITNTTIGSDDNVTIQFMIPTRQKGESGNLFVNNFLNIVKQKGLDEAIKTWDEGTKNWENELPEKGMEVSNDGAYADFIPFGPSIKGKYDDCGDFTPDSSKINTERIKILEGILHCPLESLMTIATDDRWYKYGFIENDKRWKVEGVKKNCPSWLLDAYKKLTLTYIKSEVFDELKEFEFDPENGIADDYSKECKKEYISDVKKEFKKAIDFIEKKKDNNIDVYKLGPILYLRRKTNVYITYAAGLIKTKEFGHDWFFEQCIFMYNLGTMCMKLRRSNYGSQHLNWKGYKRIISKLNLEENVEA
jgi:hypothetical protein